MMQLDILTGFAADQEKGHWFELVDPNTGEGTGIRLKMAGPDSATQNRSRLALGDALVALSDRSGHVSSEKRETARLESLAACVLDWECQEGGTPLTFTTSNLLRLLRAGSWVQAQVDSFAADRSPYRLGA